jgi:hypothetical protein
MFVAPHPLKTEYSGKYYHVNILLPQLLECSLHNPGLIEQQQEVKPEALKKAARFTALYRAEIAGVPRFPTPGERRELYSIGRQISREMTVGFTHPAALDGGLVVAYLEKHAIKTYDWPQPKF